MSWKALSSAFVGNISEFLPECYNYINILQL